jgi:cardiolipin synthase
MLASLIGAILLLLHAAGVLAAMHAVMNTRTPQGAFAWALGLVLLPYLTLVPYLYLGRSHFHGYVDLHRLRREQMQTLARVQLTAGLVSSEACSRYDEIAHMLGAQFHVGQKLKLLINGDATFDAILAAISEAKHCVLLQFFIIHDDMLGRRLQQVLLERVRAGVEVCVLYDGIGSHALPRQYVDTLRDAGVSVHPFATQRRSNRFQLNFRNHRKIVVIAASSAAST